MKFNFKTRSIAEALYITALKNVNVCACKYVQNFQAVSIV